LGKTGTRGGAEGGGARKKKGLLIWEGRGRIYKGLKTSEKSMLISLGPEGGGGETRGSCDRLDGKKEKIQRRG